jgi:MFS superfamily sulfate permease-like transporter
MPGQLAKAVLAAIVLTSVCESINFAAMFRVWRISRVDFYAAAIVLVSVLSLGIFQGVLLAAAASVLLLLVRASHPHVAFLGRVPGTDSYSDLDRHQGCCTASTPNWQVTISLCASSEPAAGCVISCGPMASPTRWAVSIDLSNR